jgi:nicotinate-nucleotide pyrophosphorylase (carboxylating)
MTMDKDIQGLIKKALQEDTGSGDVTSRFMFDENFPVSAVLTAKGSGIICGIDIFRSVFLVLSPAFTFRFSVEDGAKVNRNLLVAEIKGPVKEMLAGERTALNFLQHLSGIATLTKQFVEKAGKVDVYDTRKTTPLLRKLEKYAVKTGGGRNHRFGLYDMVLIKDNHISAFMQRKKIKNRVEAIRQSVGGVKAKAKDRYKIEVEVEDFYEARAGFLAGADIIMFDNAGVKELKRFVNLLGEKRKDVIIEWSGNVDIKTIERIKSLPVDRVSVGVLTHSAKALDFSLKVL